MLQVNIFMLFLVLSGIYFFREKRDILAGLFFAAAISIKVIPVLFLVYFVIKRQFRVCVFIIIWLVILSLLIPAIFMGLDCAWQSLLVWNKNMFITSTSFEPNPEMVGAMFNPTNQSVPGFLFRWLARNDFLTLHLKRIDNEFYAFMMNWTFSLKEIYVLYVAKAVTAILMLITFAFCLRESDDRKGAHFTYEYSLIFLASLIANPVLRTQQLVLILLPLLFMLSRIKGEKAEYRFPYIAFLVFAFFYLFQCVRLFMIFGFGTLSILWLWYFTVTQYKNTAKSRA